MAFNAKHLSEPIEGHSGDVYYYFNNLYFTYGLFSPLFILLGIADRLLEGSVSSICSLAVIAAIACAITFIDFIIVAPFVSPALAMIAACAHSSAGPARLSIPDIKCSTAR